MVGSSKILTVSYGTFSCTLEGFDDSFSTMKDIAEYFRDLAADDRYFGAEPPTPDADMLARIAERSATQRVEARTGSEGIVLKAGSALTSVASGADIAARATTAVIQPDPAQFVSEGLADTETETETAASDEDALTMPPAAEAPDNPAPVMFAPEASDDAEDVATAEAPDLPDADSVASKLQRIRAVVGRTAPVEPDVDETTSLFEDATDDVQVADDNILGDAAVAEDFAEAFAKTELPEDAAEDADAADAVAANVMEAMGDAEATSDDLEDELNSELEATEDDDS